MAIISASVPLVTLINVFRVQPEHQETVIALLQSATDDVMCRLPGFVSANVHRSLDGTNVVNYVQWRSREDFEAIFANELATRHMRSIKPYLISSERNLYSVCSVHTVEEEAVCPS